MGQINSSQDLENSTGNPRSIGGNSQQNEKETQLQREANSEQVRCVKTRIDMLIEDCLNTKDSNAENEKNRSTELIAASNVKGSAVNERKVENMEINESTSKDGDTGGSSAKSEEAGTCEKHEKDGTSSDKGCNECKEVVKDDKKVVKEGLKLHDLITDMVQTELTQKQLKQIQQRTITTFNTFIDKVLDNSLNQDKSNEVKSKPSNILKLCSESMIPNNEKKNEVSSGDVEVNEKPECDRDIDKPQRVTLKDHIERFLEISFRDENINEEKKTKESSTSVQENFNAQGLVNSMINQGIQINRLLTTKEQQHIDEQKLKVHKEFEAHNKQARPSDHNLKQHPQEMYGQRSPNSSYMKERTDSRSHHSATNYQTMDPKFREHYLNVPGYRNSQIQQGFSRRDEMIERGREMHTKMGVGSKNDMGMLSNMKVDDRMSAFHQPHGLHGPNNAYFNHPYGPRMQLSPGQLREAVSSARGDSKQVIHVRDCMCAMCVHQHHARHGVEGIVMDHHAGKRSPNVPHPVHAGQAYSGLAREVPTMMRPSHSEVPPGMMAYQGMHKLLPQHSPINSTKAYGAGQLLIPGEISAHGIVNSRPLNTPDTQSHLAHFHSRRGEEILHSSVGNDRPNIRTGKQSPYSVRPSSLPSQEHGSLHQSRPGSGHRFYELDYTRSSDSSSCTSDGSTEAPLDLSVKKPKPESVRGRSSSNASAVRKINPSNSFIKHLESSVDRYWQELNSPPNSPTGPIPATSRNRSHSPLDNRYASHMYSQQSPNGSSPAGLLTMLQNRPLPSPHYTGGITVGQPLVDIKPQVTPKHTEYQSSNLPQTGSQVMFSQMPQTSQGRQPNFDMNSKLNKMTHEQNPYRGNPSNTETVSKQSSNVSKHEPIQNIIGNHDPNDILYLICRLCTQTYGSPYGFRKHFRNQHGFEPRAEHTIVQTISATKSALHLPQPKLIQAVPEAHESRVIRKSVSPESEKLCSTSNSGRKSSSVSPTDTKSLTGSEEGDKIENTETKCLECPKCGKSFQLNDFGSYKRHCRQHGNVKMNGPFSCTDCHLPFPDQKSLREHYITHVKDAQQDQKNEGNANKLESHPTFYVCVECDKQYDNVESYNCHMNSHNLESKSKAIEAPGPVKSEQKSASSAVENDMSNIVTSPTVVIQAAESNTALACPDSSSDNVTKGEVSSNKSDSIPDSEDSCGSNTKNSAENSIAMNEAESHSPVILATQISVESGSETDKKGDETEFYYKHKKFFHHRKRSISTQSQFSDVSDAKKVKLNLEEPVNVLENSNLPISSSTTSSVSLSCDSTGTSEAKVSEKVAADETVTEKMVEKSCEKPVKTEARHSLPFVWDRTTRSQKKL